jgi:hypothetical protein
MALLLMVIIICIVIGIVRIIIKFQPISYTPAELCSQKLSQRSYHFKKMLDLWD